MANGGIGGRPVMMAEELRLRGSTASGGRIPGKRDGVPLKTLFRRPWQTTVLLCQEQPWIMHNQQKKANSVKGTVSLDTGASLGEVVHVRQVAPDRHQSTVRNNESIRIGTWNVRTLYQSGKLENVTQEMARLVIHILGVWETRWDNKGSTDFQSYDYRIIHSGGETHQRGVGIILDKERAKCLMGYWAISDRVILVKLKGQPFNISIIIVYAPPSESSEEEIVAFYNKLEEAKSHCKSQEIVVIMGDLNAKVGQEADGEVIGKHGLGIQNERGERWAQWCKTNGQIITNTWFKHHQRRIWTWNSPGGQYKNQIDYITINKRFKNAVQQTKTYPGADCGIDHRLLFCKVKIKLKKLQQGKATPKLNYELLQKDPEIKQSYTVKVKNRFEALRVEEKSKWNIFKEALVTSAKEVIPKKERPCKSG
ncbi:craniofacial development protein 2-like [Rhopilema esculentum]|uniref:craniofacial development protein 2-like n=1 Tax=Rhopilema esculentum TaxID=499914 RepID=UPI0031D79B6F